MYLDKEKKQEIFGKYGKSNTDTGSPESQIALFSYRISHLTEEWYIRFKMYFIGYLLDLHTCDAELPWGYLFGFLQQW